MTYKDLKIRQSWTLEQKIDNTVGTIEAFLAKTDGKQYSHLAIYIKNKSKH